jgi:DNA gyrase subunit A
MLAIVHNRPRILSLRETIDFFIEHRKEVVTRRTIFDLKKAEARAHILEGLKIALDNLDEVIALIKASASPAEAKAGLMSRFGLSDLQAQAILDMRLHRLTGLERDKIIDELNEILKYIKRLKEILASEAEILKIITGELLELKDKFGDERRSEIVGQTADISLEDTIVEEDMVVTISHTGYIKRNAVTLYRAQRRGGKGKTGMKTKEEDFVEQLFIASTKDYLMFFTDAGKIFWLKVYEIPEAGRAARGKAIVNLLNLAQGEKITTILPVKEFTDDRFIMMATRQGVVKKTNLIEYSHPRLGGIIALNLDEGDKLISVALTDGRQDVLLASRHGKSIRFKEEEVRTVGRVSRGVRGITLEDEDVVIGMEILNEHFTGSTLFTVTENGYGKRTGMDEYRCQSRGGKGVITIKTTERNGNVVDIKQVNDDNDLMLITDQGKILRVPVSGFSIIGRNTQGVRLMVMEESERVVAVARLAEKEEAEDAEGLEGLEEDEALTPDEPEEE